MSEDVQLGATGKIGRAWLFILETLDSKVCTPLIRGRGKEEAEAGAVADDNLAKGWPHNFIQSFLQRFLKFNFSLDASTVFQNK